MTPVLQMNCKGTFWSLALLKALISLFALIPNQPNTMAFIADWQNISDILNCYKTAKFHTELIKCKRGKDDFPLKKKRERKRNSSRDLNEDGQRVGSEPAGNFGCNY